MTGIFRYRISRITGLEALPGFGENLVKGNTGYVAIPDMADNRVNAITG
jgi:hypothetical protein